MKNKIDRRLLRAPFIWFGGKSKIAKVVWSRLGDCPNVVEPFFGSGAFLLARPHYPWQEGSPRSVNRRETIGDADGLVCNFWRAVKHDPEGVAAGADRIVHELDLHAVGDRLFYSGKAKEFVEKLRADEAFYDAEWAGAWAWFISNWIGGLPSVTDAGGGQGSKGVSRKIPHLRDAGKGVSRQIPHLRDAGKGVSRQIPHLGGSKGECMKRREALIRWMQTLSDRFRNVRCCCGDWSRITGPSVTWKNALPCGVFLDPPYSDTADRTKVLYSSESDVTSAVREWMVEEGKRPGMRIAYCSYGEFPVPQGWNRVFWKSRGGYGSQGNGKGRDNAKRECIDFSPHCLKPVKVKFDL